MEDGPDLKFARFAAESLLAQLAAMTAEADGVLQAQDIEYVHRMRVASRRLRTRLALFAPVLPKKKAAEWTREVKRITRALGQARDTDVQLKVLADFFVAAPAKAQPGGKRLLLRFGQQRARLQLRVAKAVARLQRSGMIEDMEATLRAVRVHARLAENGAESLAICREAQVQGERHLEEMLGYELYVSQPKRAAELHAMRIAAKRLRYALETFAPQFPGAFEEYLKEIKHLQDLLGDLHDCDVWLGTLPQFLEDERALAREYFGHARGVSRLAPGLTALEKDRKRRRRQVYQEFVAHWDKLAGQDLWGKLLRELERCGAPAGAPPAPPEETETRP
jgi:CHAD domain-containing protein